MTTPADQLTETEPRGSRVPRPEPVPGLEPAAAARDGRGWLRRWRRRGGPGEGPSTTPAEHAQTESGRTAAFDLDIDADDPVLAFLHDAPGPVEIGALPAFSPAVRTMRERGVVLVVPMVTSGELVGLLALGPRLSERGYNRDDRRLLDDLARFAAPALRLGQLVREQEVQARSRERIDQELRVAQLIQQQFLPHDLPTMPGWEISAYYEPARTVGGDFYDVLLLDDGRIMIVTGDVTDKGVPAALVMASTHALLRATGPRLVAPGAVLERVNRQLCSSIPDHMFVTCLVLVLDPATGAVELANAGHNLPLVRTAGGVVEIRATGMPLGLMPESRYEEATGRLEPGDVLLLFSDGLTEQHDSAGRMLGLERVRALVADGGDVRSLVDRCVAAVSAHAGPVEQEDDVTLVALARSREVPDPADGEVLASAEVPSEAGNERLVMDLVTDAVAPLGLTDQELERLRTAVSETAMNAIEHGNAEQPDVPVGVVVSLTADGSVVVEVTDRGAGRPSEPETPDLDLKLAGLQPNRGWGLFLVQHMVDEVGERTEDGRHTVRLVLHRGEGR